MPDSIYPCEIPRGLFLPPYLTSVQKKGFQDMWKSVFSSHTCNMLGPLVFISAESAQNISTISLNSLSGSSKSSILVMHPWLKSVRVALNRSPFEAHHLDDLSALCSFQAPNGHAQVRTTRGLHGPKHAWFNNLSPKAKVQVKPGPKEKNMAPF